MRDYFAKIPNTWPWPTKMGWLPRFVIVRDTNDRQIFTQGIHPLSRLISCRFLFPGEFVNLCIYCTFPIYFRSPGINFLHSRAKILTGKTLDIIRKAGTDTESMRKRPAVHRLLVLAFAYFCSIAHVSGQSWQETKTVYVYCSVGY